MQEYIDAFLNRPHTGIKRGYLPGTAIVKGVRGACNASGRMPKRHNMSILMVGMAKTMAIRNFVVSTSNFNSIHLNFS